MSKKKGSSCGCAPYIIMLLLAIVGAVVVTSLSESMDELGSLPNEGFLDSLPDIPGLDFDIEDTGNVGTDTDSGSTGGYINNTNPSSNAGKTLYYNQLNSVEQEMYRTVLDGLNRGNNKFKFKSIPFKNIEDTIFRVIGAVTYDNPSMFWIQHGYSYSYTHVPFSDVLDMELSVMQYSYWDYVSNKAQKLTELNNAVKSVAAQARQYTDVFEQVAFVHDYLVKNAIYDYDGLNEYYKSVHDPSCEYIFSAYGCLVNGKTVCSGYAKAFQLIMTELGYDCIYVTGEAGESHAWNCLFIENEGYYIDVTWDDPDGGYNEAKYDYFCITNETLAKTHTLDTDFETPLCTATKYNYFEYNGYILDYYNFEDVCEIFERQGRRNIYSVQFRSREEASKAYKDLISNGKCFKIPILNGRDLSQSTSEEFLTLNIYVK